MAGGVGSRFWPMSRRKNPKQFLSILSEKSMIKMTVDRLSSLIQPENIYIVTSKEQQQLTQKNLPELPRENIIIEPFGMNTAPCIGLSVQYLLRKYKKDEQMLVLPADHLISDETGFISKIKEGSEYAAEGNLVTFGINPEYPATGYGYIEGGNILRDSVYEVARFKEKPDFETAKEFVTKGNFFWNSGMFLWKLDTINSAFRLYLPKVFNLLEKIDQYWDNEGISADISTFYKQMPAIPVDIGIMEQAEKRVVLSVSIGWSDVGSWKALYDHLDKDQSGNTLADNVYYLNANCNLVKSSKFVAMIDVDDLVVVESDDSLLISKLKKSEDVKKVVDYLKKNRPDLT